MADAIPNFTPIRSSPAPAPAVEPAPSSPPPTPAPAAPPAPPAKPGKVEFSPEQQEYVNRIMAEDRRKTETRLRSELAAATSAQEALKASIAELSGRLGAATKQQSEAQARAESEAQARATIASEYESFKTDSAIAAHPALFSDPLVSNFLKRDCAAKVIDGQLTVELDGQRVSIDQALDKLPKSVRRVNVAGGIGGAPNEPVNKNLTPGGRYSDAYINAKLNAPGGTQWWAETRRKNPELLGLAPRNK